MKRALVVATVVLLGTCFVQTAQACPPGYVLCCNTGIQTCTLKCFKQCVPGLTADPSAPAGKTSLAPGAGSAEPQQGLSDRLVAFLASLWAEAGKPAATPAR